MIYLLNGGLCSSSTFLIASMRLYGQLISYEGSFLIHIVNEKAISVLLC